MKTLTTSKKTIQLACVLFLLLLTQAGLSQPLLATVQPSAQCYNLTGSSAMAQVVSAPAGAVSFSWTVSSGTCQPFPFPLTQDGSSVGLFVSCCGVFSVDCIAYDVNNNPVGNFATSMTISCGPTVTLNTLPTTSVFCSGTSATLSASGASTYTWFPAATGSLITVAPTANTCYTVIGADAVNCTNQAVSCITVSPKPTITASSGTPLICKGKSATLTANGGQFYLWTGSSSTTSVAVISPTITTNYTVTGTNASGCSGQAIITQSVNNCAGINERNTGLTLAEIYPNPGNGIFNIKMAHSVEQVFLQVYNSLGKLIVERHIDSGLFKLDLSEYPEGLFYIKLNNTTRSETFRIIKYSSPQ